MGFLYGEKPTVNKKGSAVYDAAFSQFLVWFLPIGLAPAADDNRLGDRSCRPPRTPPEPHKRPSPRSNNWPAGRPGKLVLKDEIYFKIDNISLKMASIGIPVSSE